MLTINCAFPGCKAAHSAPVAAHHLGLPERWSYWLGVDGIRGGYYCPLHTDALEAEVKGKLYAELQAKAVAPCTK
jgi:hypothetical protein